MNHYDSSRRPEPNDAGKARRGATQREGGTLALAQLGRRRIPLTSLVVLAISAAVGCQDAARPTSPEMPLTEAFSALGGEKTTVCHAAGRADNLKFAELTLSGAALSAHLGERGSARAGHEGDYLVTTRTPCPPPATGPNVRICKTVDGEFPLRQFAFEVNGEEISISGSTCANRTFRVGTPITITETIAAGTALNSITITPPAAGTGDIAARTATVIAGNDLAQVIFGNRVLLGSLVICKQVEPVGLVGKQFEFVVTPHGGSFISPPALVMAPGACFAAGSYTVGTAKTVIEVPSLSSLDVGIITSGITVVPADRLVPGSLSLESRRVSVTIGEGMTQVRFVNARPVGSLEICNVTPAGFTGAAQFFVIEMYGDERNVSVTVPANQCVSVHPIGFGFPVNYSVRIGEAVPSGLRLDAVTVDPPDRLGTLDLAMRWAIVRIGTGNTKVTFHHVFTTP